MHSSLLSSWQESKNKQLCLDHERKHHSITFRERLFYVSRLKQKDCPSESGNVVFVRLLTILSYLFLIKRRHLTVTMSFHNFRDKKGRVCTSCCDCQGKVNMTKSVYLFQQEIVSRNKCCKWDGEEERRYTRCKSTEQCSSFWQSEVIDSWKHDLPLFFTDHQPKIMHLFSGHRRFCCRISVVPIVMICFEFTRE
jgi:hypothetical protein